MFLEMNYTRRLLTLIKIGKTILMGCLIIGLMGITIQLPPKIFICIPPANIFLHQNNSGRYSGVNKSIYLSMQHISDKPLLHSSD